MIRIKKPAKAPDKLSIEGKAEIECNNQLFEKGASVFAFKKNIYGHKSVKDSLKAAQHQKCCFCERKEEMGDIEHFRPKSHYYWLAYDWDNLFFCCPTCNRSYKKDLFPLFDESKRAYSHLDDISLEEPLFIHPEKSEPEKYIEYRGYKPHAINDNQKGLITIQKTGLDRIFFSEDREQWYQMYKTIYESIEAFITLLKNGKIDSAMQQQFKNHLIKNQKKLEEAQKDNAQYASMIRCAVKDKFRF
jgi:uncharacterized protein (TIGR02646 family)